MNFPKIAALMDVYKLPFWRYEALCLQPYEIHLHTPSHYFEFEKCFTVTTRKHIKSSCAYSAALAEQVSEGFMYLYVCRERERERALAVSSERQAMHCGPNTAQLPFVNRGARTQLSKTKHQLHSSRSSLHHAGADRKNKPNQRAIFSEI